MSADARRARLVRLLEPVVAEAGLELEDVEVTPAGRRRLLRVVVDADDGVSLDDIAEASRTVSDALDSSDAMGGAPYVLEVTSPGVDRELREPRHWRRAAGRLVRAPLASGGEVEGRVVSADDAGVVLEVGAEQRGFGYGELGNGKVQVEFRRAQGSCDAE
ncbi:ribosome maturation factor RimP [Allonocardiopsis opalescens]|uniref:Ribosome maturation factor RimP n=1 Tax=Allonocardiopsis opalescens TaxID=1144618 RepID=A0A2T0QFB3_9ACTN|nr:ribosome maturation factor RimP [Allonocardiopsis opalescens]PRY02608.1 ribosome maturation factor RimP [Allonocardiopsis opalescens]